MPMPERPARAALANDDADDRSADLAHGHQVFGDDQGLPALFGGDARIGARRIDERDDRQAEFLGQPHFHECLAIALGMGAAEVALLALGEVFPLLMADEHDLDVVEVGQAGDDRLVVAQGAVAVQLEELLEDQVDVVAGLGPLLVARNLDDLPGLEMGVDSRLSAASSRLSLRICSAILGESPAVRFLA